MRIKKYKNENLEEYIRGFIVGCVMTLIIIMGGIILDLENQLFDWTFPEASLLMILGMIIIILIQLCYLYKVSVFLFYKLTNNRFKLLSFLKSE